MDNIKCHQCGKENNIDAKFCQNCGSPIIKDISDNGENITLETNTDESKNIESSKNINNDEIPIVDTTQVKKNHLKIKVDFISYLNKYKIVIGICVVLFIVILLFATKVICFHDWKTATCTKSQICRNCGDRKGESLGHEWETATCISPVTCSRCQLTKGSPLGHSVSEWNVSKEATCTERGIQSGLCNECNKNITELIPVIEHSIGEWEITKLATYSENGLKAQKCTVCGEVINEEEYELTAEEKIAAYKQECGSYSYNEIARNPDSYNGKLAKFTGEVIQVMEDGNNYTLRVNITKDKYYWDDTILVSYTRKNDSESRILEDDIITMYGELAGMHTYESIMGASITVPLFYAEYIEF